MNTNNSVLIGALAGLAGGLMALTAYKAGFLAVVLMFAAPAAIYIAAMGWGTRAGIIATIVATGLSGIFGSPPFALLTGLLLFAPAAWVGHLTNLAQPADNGSGLVWYPLSAILLRLMSALAIGFLIVGAVSGFSLESFADEFVVMMKQIAASNPDLPVIEEEELKARGITFARLIPVVVPAAWLMLHVMTAFVSASITRRSGLLAREPEDIAATVNLPFEATGFMAVGLIGAFFLSGIAALAGGVFLGLAISGFGLIGLAQLHYRTRPMPSRGFILGIAYAMIVMFNVPILIFTVMGLIRSFSQNRSGPASPNSPNSNSGSGSGSGSGGSGPSNPTE